MDKATFRLSFQAEISKKIGRYGSYIFMDRKLREGKITLWINNTSALTMFFDDLLMYS
jgi:hypothetical protein